MIYDCKLVVINHAEEIFYLNLHHPFIEFVMHLQHENFDTCLDAS
jgi:hypothetical protein